VTNRSAYHKDVAASPAPPNIMDIAEPQAAVAIVQARQPANSVLLMRRSERKEDPWSGHWSFPGGRRDPDDPDLLHTALRELEEECGVRIQRDFNVAVLPPVLARRTAGPFLLVAPFVFHVDSELPTVVDLDEAMEAVWFPLNTLCDPTMHSLRNVPRLPANWLFPAIDLKGTPVWGFTYRLAMDWLALLPTQISLEDAGFQMASRVLDFLLSLGLKLTRPWEAHPAPSESAATPSGKLATVEGQIPVDLVLAHFSAPQQHFPSINILEVRADRIRVVGLAFEEYLIVSSEMNG
jgi:8-oxo-dGTP pyrophosphatase MutT (NUDIX family)